MDILNLLVSLISGAVGGNIGGALTEKNLGTLANTIIGLLGGGAGDFILKALGVISSAAATAPAATGGGLDIASLLTTIGVSGVSGGVITAIVSAIKNAVDKK